jgi:hypothetical protein
MIAGTVGADRPLIEAPITGTAQMAAASERVRSQEETNRVYGYVYDRGTRVRIESARVSPGITHADEEIDLILTYVVLSHSDESVPVREIREVWLEDSLWKRIELQTERTGGSYRSTQSVRLPGNIEKGRYKAVYIVQTDYSRDLREAAFSVVED